MFQLILTRSLSNRALPSGYRHTSRLFICMSLLSMILLPSPADADARGLLISKGISAHLLERTTQLDQQCDLDKLNTTVIPPGTIFVAPVGGAVCNGKLTPILTQHGILALISASSQEYWDSTRLTKYRIDSADYFCKRFVDWCKRMVGAERHYRDLIVLRGPVEGQVTTRSNCAPYKVEANTSELFAFVDAIGDSLRVQLNSTHKNPCPGANPIYEIWVRFAEKDIRYRQIIELSAEQMIYLETPKQSEKTAARLKELYAAYRRIRFDAFQRNCEEETQVTQAKVDEETNRLRSNLAVRLQAEGGLEADGGVIAKAIAGLKASVGFSGQVAYEKEVEAAIRTAAEWRVQSTFKNQAVNKRFYFVPKTKEVEVIARLIGCDQSGQVDPLSKRTVEYRYEAKTAARVTEETLMKWSNLTEVDWKASDRRQDWQDHGRVRVKTMDEFLSLRKTLGESTKMPGDELDWLMAEIVDLRQ